MQEFVDGTADKFRVLDQAISEGKVFRYPDRVLPECCNPRRACLWFGKVNDSYRIRIDMGITTSEGSNEFKRFLERGGATFTDLGSMINFLHSLKPLFPVDNGASKVINRERLNEICAERKAPKQIWPEDISDRLKKNIFGQDEVIDELAEKIVINKMRSDRKLFVAAFLGPTATGKSETAKSLAEVLTSVYGKKYGYIEIAGSEFIGEHTVHRFFGAPPGYVGHGEHTILDPVRKNPNHVIVINEIEKADDKILVGLMEAIDTGFLGMADNTAPINLNECVLILTSNIQIDMKKYNDLTVFEKAEMCRDAFTNHCRRPEISGKIGNFLVFRQLSDEALTDIFIKFIREELNSYELELAHVDEYLMTDFLKQRTKYGARGIRGIVSEAVGRHLLRNRNISTLKGKQISIKGTVDNIVIEEIQEV